MKNDDVNLIQRVLAGDDTAFSALVKKHQKPVHALAWRENWRLSHRRRDYARHLSESVSEPFNAEGTAEVCGLALCDSGELLQDVEA